MERDDVAAAPGRQFPPVTFPVAGGTTGGEPDRLGCNCGWQLRSFHDSGPSWLPRDVRGRAGGARRTARGACPGSRPMVETPLSGWGAVLALAGQGLDRGDADPTGDAGALRFPDGPE